jgi:DNA-binding beta-propeller fold protein YncE
MTQITGYSRSGRGVPIIIAVVCSTILAALGALAQPGDLYVTNLATNTIDVYSPEGVKSTFATGLSSPQGLVFDHAHNLYVADGGTGTIFKYDMAGNRTTFYAGLSAPVGLAVHDNRLLVAESGLGQVWSLTLDGSGHPKRILLGRDSIVGVEVAGDFNFVTWDTELNYNARDGFSVFVFLYAAPRGLTVVPRATGFDDFDVYVAQADGTIWVVSIADRNAPSKELFVFGLNDPWGVAFAPRGFETTSVGALYVADRANGKIFQCTFDPFKNVPPLGVQSVFISDAGIPNFLAFETD